MWTLNGERTLPFVLKQIESVIPREEMGRKIAADDSSTDGTRSILRDFNWEVYNNKKGYISGGAAEALSHVQTKHFISVEQDILLPNGWFEALSKHFIDQKVAVAQGVEVSVNSVEKAYADWTMKKVVKMPLENRWELWNSIGNNMYRTDVIKRLGFIEDKLGATIFFNRIKSAGFKWITDVNVKCLHLHRRGIVYLVDHNAHFLKKTDERIFLDNLTLPRYLVGFAVSPLRGGYLALTRKHPMVQLHFVLEHFIYFPIFLERKRQFVRVH